MIAVMWSQTVGLRTRPVDQKIGLGLGLAGLVLCCEKRSCYARRVNGHSNFSSTFIVSLFCAWHITTVRSTVAFIYLKV